VNEARSVLPFTNARRAGHRGPACEGGIARVIVAARAFGPVHARRIAGAMVVAGAIAVLLACSSMSACQSHSESAVERIHRTGVLRVGTDATYPPFESVDPSSGQLTGFDIDLVRAIARLLPARVEFVVVPFDGIVPGLKSGKYDLIISAMTITPERAQQIRFTRPYTTAGQSIVVRAGDASVMGPTDLAGKRIGCQLGTTGEMEARKIERAQVVSFDAIGSAFRDLENGHLEAAIADTPTARIFIRDHPTLRLAGEPLTQEEFGMAVRLEDPDLAEEIDRAMDRLGETGERRAIEERWGVAAQ